MSNLADAVEQVCDVDEGGNALELVIRPRDRDIGGFSVRRALPNVGRKQVGPWVFFDHMGPVHFAPGPGINVRPHPHVNLATVTYLFEGEILHRDSLGSVQAITPGAINLMVAGRGIVHSERERPEATRDERGLHGLQLWLALPERDEETVPAFYHYPCERIPAVTVGGVAVRVMMGSAYGVVSPVTTFADTLYVEATLETGQRLALPRADERAVYVVEGQLALGEATLMPRTMAVIGDEENVAVSASKPSRIVIIGGERLGKRYIEWNFVSSHRERIEQSKRDWKEGRFATVPGDEEEFIPLPAG
ncbi:MAG TPA: pirin family protein [Gammaproteobacteria bacterium]|nr:pirin family protein [Gammaproteobacteria bacterium]